MRPVRGAPVRRQAGGIVAALLLAAWLPGAAWSQSPDEPSGGEPEPADSGNGNTGFAKISGVVNRLSFRYLQRAIELAGEHSLDTLVVHIDTDGGEVYYAREMFKLILDQEREGRRMVAFVDFRAISAGAMIAYAHESIYVSETASIGDIGVIFQAGGEIKYAPEKIETVVRTLLAQAAEQRGWSRGLLLKMTARNQKLYRVTRDDGSEVYVIEDDLPDFLARNTGIDEENDQQVIVYRGEDRLLTLTGRQAARLGMATALAPDLDAVYERLGINPSAVIDLSPSVAERTAAMLSGIAPILAGLAFLFIIFELKTPGVGLFALLGALCGALFLIAQYYLDMAQNLEIVMMVLGMVLLAVEFLTVAGGGLIGIAGGLLAFTGLMLSFVPNEFDYDFSDGVWREALASATWSSLLSVAIVVIGLFVFMYAIPRSPLRRRLAVVSEVSATSAGQLETTRVDELRGRIGEAAQALRPGGSILIDGESYSARVEHGAYLDAGQAVEIVGVEFGELIVRAAEGAPSVRPPGDGRRG